MKKPRIPLVGEKQFPSLLKKYNCQVPHYEVRTRFLGNIATPATTASPIHIVNRFWGRELPEFESLEAVNDLTCAISEVWSLPPSPFETKQISTLIMGAREFASLKQRRERA